MKHLNDEKKNKLIKWCSFAVWFLVGFFIEMQMLVGYAITNGYEIFSRFISVLVPVILLWLLNYHEKILEKKKIFISKFYLKSILCIYIGTIIKCNIFYRNDEYMIFLMVESIILISFIVFFRIIQKIYQKLQNKEMYWWYIVLGLMLSANISYVWENFSHLKYCFNDAVKHFILLILVIFINVYKYKRYHKIQIVKNNIDLADYICNAVKMTMLTFILLLGVFKMFCTFV